jgi:hypothetical protein
MMPRQSIQVLDLKISKKKSDKKETPFLPDKQKLLELLQGGQPVKEIDSAQPTRISKAKKIQLDEEVPL